MTRIRCQSSSIFISISTYSLSRDSHRITIAAVVGRQAQQKQQGRPQTVNNKLKNVLQYLRGWRMNLYGSNHGMGLATER
jgi:hypothetical protein